jgi:hypothetical protein
MPADTLENDTLRTDALRNDADARLERGEITQAQHDALLRDQEALATEAADRLRTDFEAGRDDADVRATVDAMNRVQEETGLPEFEIKDDGGAPASTFGGLAAAAQDAVLSATDTDPASAPAETPAAAEAGAESHGFLSGVGQVASQALDGMEDGALSNIMKDATGSLGSVLEGVGPILQNLTDTLEEKTETDVEAAASKVGEAVGDTAGDQAPAGGDSALRDLNIDPAMAERIVEGAQTVLDRMEEEAPPAAATEAAQADGGERSGGGLFGGIAAAAREALADLPESAAGIGPEMTEKMSDILGGVGDLLGDVAKDAVATELEEPQPEATPAAATYEAVSETGRQLDEQQAQAESLMQSASPEDQLRGQEMMQQNQQRFEDVSATIQSMGDAAKDAIERVDAVAPDNANSANANPETREPPTEADSARIQEMMTKMTELQETVKDLMEHQSEMQQQIINNLSDNGETGEVAQFGGTGEQVAPEDGAAMGLSARVEPETASTQGVVEGEIDSDIVSAAAYSGADVDGRTAQAGHAATAAHAQQAQTTQTVDAATTASTTTDDRDKSGHSPTQATEVAATQEAEVEAAEAEAEAADTTTDTPADAPDPAPATETADADDSSATAAEQTDA